MWMMGGERWLALLQYTQMKAIGIATMHTPCDFLPVSSTNAGWLRKGPTSLAGGLHRGSELPDAPSSVLHGAKKQANFFVVLGFVPFPPSSSLLFSTPPFTRHTHNFPLHLTTTQAQLHLS